jgi:hypothetical protein
MGSIGRLPLEVSDNAIHETFAFGGDVLFIEFGQLTQEFLLTFAELLGNFDDGLDQEIAFGTGVWIGHALASQSKHGSALRAVGDLEGFATIEGWDFDRGAECGLAERDGQLQDQVVSIPFEDWVGFDVDEAVGIAAGTTVRAGLTFPLESHAHVVIDTGRDFDFEFDFVRPQSVAVARFAWVADRFSAASADRASRLDAEDTGGLNDLSTPLAAAARFGLRASGGAGSAAAFAGGMAGKGNGFGHSASSFGQVEGDIASEIGTATDATAAATATEEVLEDRAAEDIAESFEDVAHIAKTTLSVVPGMPETIVTGTFLLIAEDFVGFGSFFELVNRFRIPLIGIGVILERQFAIRPRDFILGSRLLDSEDFVKISLRIGRHGVRARDGTERST